MKIVEKEYDTMKAELEQYTKRSTELESEVNILKSVIDTKNELLAKQVKAIGDDYSHISQKEREQEMEEYNQKIQMLEEQISVLKKENQELSGELIIRRDKTENYEKKLELLQRECESLRKEAETSVMNKTTVTSLAGNTVLETDLSTMSRPANDIGGILMRAHAKIRQMSDCMKKLLEGQAMETPKYNPLLTKYQKISELLGEAERDLALCRGQSPTASIVGHNAEQMKPAVGTIAANEKNKENLPSRINTTEMALEVNTKKMGYRNVCTRQSSVLMRPASAMMNHKGIVVYL